jgi:hypothetical protein
MLYWLLPISATTVQQMTNDKKATEEMNTRMTHFEERLRSVFEARFADLIRTLRDVDPSYIIGPEIEDQEFYNEFMRVINDTRLKHADVYLVASAKVTSDPCVGMEMAIARGADGETMHARVRKRVRDKDGSPVGTAHANPLLDSRRYKVEYVDGYIEELTVHLIAKNLIAHVDNKRPASDDAIAHHGPSRRNSQGSGDVP